LTSTSKLTDKVEELPGVGSLRATHLKRLGIRRAADLLFFFPRNYEDIAAVQGADSFVENTRVSLVATVVEMAERVTQSGKHMLGVQTAAEGGVSVRLLWYNQPFRKNDIRVGQRLLVTGVLRSTVLNWEIVQPTITALVGDELPRNPEPLPVYPLTEGLKQASMRGMMREALPGLIPLVEEALPIAVRERGEVPEIATALRHIHFPPTLEAAELARRRFKLQELLVLQLAIAMQRKARERESVAPVCEPTGKIHSRILNRLQFQLTPDQLSAIDDIGNDMSQPKPMNRLLQGDVGSGKTLVAQYAMLLCVAHGYQAALMAPTEVLARQHAATLQRSLSSSRVRVALVTGSMPRAARTETLAAIAAGHIDLIVGTQALLSSELVFRNLALVIVDEQHKFGVMQRAQLRTDQTQPHYLVLSATPIPRTIAMTAFGDLDISTIRTKPAGRAPVHTYTCTKEQLSSWWKFVDDQIAKGRQAYVIAPRVADTENSDVATAEGVFKLLRTGPFEHRTIGLLHGRMTGEQKESVLTDFTEGALDILVATTVVEVGIDVPNATVMTILDADRLGLSQLHQLRGRISRGSHAGFVCAVAESSSAASGGAAPQASASRPGTPALAGAGVDNLGAANERLRAFEASDDGFQLAEMDLQMRGPGDLLGTSQSGLPTLRIANLVEDGPLVELARQVARELLDADPDLSNPELARLVQQTLKRYGKSMQLSDVG
jgi:ATP-dependent DNA helicase RecG